MTGPGRKPAVTAEEIHELMESSTRPVWSSSDMADHFDVSRPTAKSRLEDLRERESVGTVDVGNTTAYFVKRWEELDPIEELKEDLIREFTDEFVGLQSEPWTAVHYEDGVAVAGDKVQIFVEGRPNSWEHRFAARWKSREELEERIWTTPDEVQALISGVLYERPTTPIEHTDYDADYDLEGQIGARDIDTEKGRALLATGPKNYLIRPCNDAVFLKDVSVDWISPREDNPDEPDPYTSEEPGL